jgi:hypothetical protein
MCSSTRSSPNAGAVTALVGYDLLTGVNLLTVLA